MLKLGIKVCANLGSEIIEHICEHFKAFGRWNCRGNYRGVSVVIVLVVVFVLVMVLVWVVETEFECVGGVKWEGGGVIG